MRVLLANMPIKFNHRENLEPPLGISYLGAMLEGAGHEIFLKDYEVEGFSEDSLVSFVKENKIQIVGVSFRTASYRSAKIFVNALKCVRDSIVVVVGGHHAAAFPKQTIMDLSCDIVVRGEGEYTITELVEAIENVKPLSGIKGISYNEDGRIIDNEERGRVADLDVLPYPAREPLPYERYTVATVLTSRGCPFRCIYCDKNISTCQVKYRSPENVYQEISEICRRYPGKRILFVDDHFFLSKKRVNKIFDLIERNGLKFNWMCASRADGVELDLLKRAKAVGCELMIYGIESGDPEELEYMRKQATVEDARNALILTKEAGIRARANFMLGFPISTHKTTRNSIRFAKSVPLEVVRFFSVAPLPNTELWDRVYGNNTDLNTVNWDEFDFYTPSFSSKELSKQDIMNYLGAATIYVLSRRVLKELSVTFPRRFTKLLRLSFKKRRIRGNISISFPSTVNLILDLKTEMHTMSLYRKMRFLTGAVYLANKI